MATLVDGLYVDCWYYGENRMYAYIYGNINRVDNRVYFNYSSGQVKLDQVTQYGSTGYTQPFGIKNASGNVVTTGSIWWPYDYMYPATFWKDISGLSSWTYDVSSSTTSMGLYLYAEDGDKYTTVSFPAKPSVSVQSVSDESITLSVSIAGYGDTSSGSRYIEAAVMDANNTSYGRPYRFKTATAATSATFTIDNSATGGTLVLAPNTKYKYGGYASTSTERRAQTITGTTATTCSAPTLSLNPMTTTPQGVLVSITAKRGTDGGYDTERTLKIRYSDNDGYSYSDWVDGGNLNSNRLSTTFTARGFLRDHDYILQAKIVTTAGDSPVTTIRFNTPSGVSALESPKVVTQVKSLSSSDDVVSYSDGTGEKFVSSQTECKYLLGTMYYQDGYVYSHFYQGDSAMSIDKELAPGEFVPLGTDPTIFKERGLTLDTTKIQEYTSDKPASVLARWYGHVSEKTQKVYVGQNNTAKSVKVLYASKNGRATKVFEKQIKSS